MASDEFIAGLKRARDITEAEAIAPERSIDVLQDLSLETDRAHLMRRSVLRAMIKIEDEIKMAQAE